MVYQVVTLQNNAKEQIISPEGGGNAIYQEKTTISCEECPSFDECDNCGSASYVIGVQVAYFIWLMYLFIALGMTADAFFVPILVSVSKAPIPY